MNFLVPLLFAFAYRFRGTDVKGARTFWAYTNTLYALTITNSLSISALVAVASLAGRFFPNKQGLQPTFKNYLYMAGVGSARALLVAIPFSILTPYALLFTFAGTLSGLSYFIGYKFLEGKIAIPYVKGGTEWGEVLTGLFWGIGFMGLAL